MEIELKNYRAFSDEAPARWTLEDGFTAFVGVNNSGKSSLLRFFHEIRPSLNRARRDSELWRLLEKEDGPQMDFLGVADNQEVFHNGNERPMTATFSLVDLDPTEPQAIRFVWQRNLQLALEIEWAGAICAVQTANWPKISIYTNKGGATLNLTRYLSALQDCANSIYLGPFRNAVNVGGQASYYDLQIGEQFIASWDQIKTGNERKKNRSAVAVQDELRKIFGLDRLEINASPGNATMQVIADD